MSKKASATDKTRPRERSRKKRAKESPGNAEALGGSTGAPPGRPRDLQTLVTRLLGFWTEHGCTLLPPADFPVPAATLHPDVFFRFLDRGPQSSVFLQPVRRPMDRRDGRHPFRFSRPLQLEVIWSGPGAAMQPMFVDSLRDVGLDLGGHDLLFADGLYASRTLAARGMSWHATLDGLGVARMSFVHQALGREVDPPICEVVYGLERLAMVLWGIDRADDLAWRRDGESRGDLFGGLEKEYSAYLTRAADLDAWGFRLENFEREARRCLDEGLLGTAYELAIRCLEGIDLLTVRGDLDLRARTERLDGIRDLVLAVAAAADPGESAEAADDA